MFMSFNVCYHFIWVTAEKEISRPKKRMQLKYLSTILLLCVPPHPDLIWKKTLISVKDMTRLQDSNEVIICWRDYVSSKHRKRWWLINCGDRGYSRCFIARGVSGQWPPALNPLHAPSSRVLLCYMILTQWASSTVIFGNISHIGSHHSICDCPLLWVWLMQPLFEICTRCEELIMAWYDLIAKWRPISFQARLLWTIIRILYLQILSRKHFLWSVAFRESRYYNVPEVWLVTMERVYIYTGCWFVPENKHTDKRRDNACRPWLLLLAVHQLI